MVRYKKFNISPLTIVFYTNNFFKIYRIFIISKNNSCIIIQFINIIFLKRIYKIKFFWLIIMHITIKNLLKINDNIKEKLLLNNNTSKSTKIIAVSKTFKIDHIKPLIEYGHIHFGENKVQEAQEKWTEVKKKNSNIQLHLIGRLQTNKVKFAVNLFDYIHSLDSKKLADKISIHQKEQNLSKKFFIQVNIGDENQKSGIPIRDTLNFYNYCKKLNLNIIGLMCIPPFNEDSSKYFKKMTDLNNKLNLKEISMGMSSDYLNAIEYGSTFVRIGSSIFGERS